MMTVHQVSQLTGVSIRTLQYYDQIGLLKATAHTEAGYRLYDDAALEKLQQILLFRELQFPLQEIKRMMDSPQFDKALALEQQITLLEMKKSHIEGLIALARRLKMVGGRYMDFQAFDKGNMEQYAREAKARWGQTEAYREYERKCGEYEKQQDHPGEEMMVLFAEMGAMKKLPADHEDVQRQVKKLQDFITTHYYLCTPVILRQLGQMYAQDGAFARNIDAAGGPGTAKFAHVAIEVYCRG